MSPLVSALMSEEQLKAFLEAVKADAGLQEKLKAASDADAVVAIAKDYGYAMTSQTVIDLSEHELEQVNGGGGGLFGVPSLECGAGDATGWAG